MKEIPPLFAMFRGARWRIMYSTTRGDRNGPIRREPGETTTNHELIGADEKENRT
jgi:hypothetical protein